MNHHASTWSRFAATAVLVISGSLLSCTQKPAIPVTESAAVRIEKANTMFRSLIGMPPEAARSIVATYEYTPGQRVDIYWPPDFAFDRPIPIALFVMAFADARVRTDTGSSAPDLAQYVEWCASAAAQGMAAIIMSVGYAKDDFPILLDYLNKNQKALSIDPSRVYLWACSDNWKMAAFLVEKGGELDGKVIGMSLYYTYVSAMTQLPGPGFPVEVVIPGKDDVNAMKLLTAYATAMSAQGNDVSFIPYPEGSHGFETKQDTPETRAIVAGTLDFIGRLASQ